MSASTASLDLRRIRESERVKPSPMRILLYTTDFLPGAGGVQKHIALLAHGLFKAGHQPTVVTETSAGTSHDGDLEFPVVRQPRLASLWRLIGDADLLHLAGPPFIPLMLGLLRRKPVVIEHHGYQAICPNGLLLHGPREAACPGHFMAGEYEQCVPCVARTSRWLYGLWQLLITFPRRWMCSRATMNTAVSRHVENRLRLPRSRTIYHGIPDTLAERQPLVSISSEPICFGFVGRLVEEKGLMVLLDAASRLQLQGYDFRLKFIGDGPERTRLEKEVLRRGLKRRVTFTGFLTGEALQRATADLTAVVMPSIMEETAGLAAIEQMMRGRLVIASDIGGLGEVVGEAGLKFPPGDAQQLAACMRRVLDETEIASEIGTRARERSAELFTDTQKTETYVSIYSELTKRRSARTEFPQRVLIYSADFWPVVGGVQSVVMTLARGFATQGHSGIECTVVTETPAGTAADSDVPFRVVRNPNLLELTRLLWRSDLVHVAGPALLPLFLAFLLRKKVVVEHHGFQALCPNGLLFHEPTRTACPGHFLAGRHGECWKCNAGSGYWHSVRLWSLTFLRRWSCRFVAANISPTHWLDRLLHLPRTFVISHGVVERPFLPGDHARDPTFIFVGRLVSTKGVELLLRASRELLNKGVEFRLLIVGEGPERRNLERLCIDLGLSGRVDFFGQTAEEDMESLLSAAVAVVMPSLAGEVFGLVAAENMMRGRPVITPDDGSLAEVAGDTGLKFTAGDATALAACMERLARSPEIAIELGKRARQYSLNRFRAQGMLDGHLALYEEVLK
jgi:glycogen(starch) synthase